MDAVGEYTLEVMKEAGWYNDWLFEHIKPFIKGSVLEAGIGIGNFTVLLEKVGNITGIDINKRYIDSGKARFGKNVKLGIGNIENGRYFFKDRQFDTVICLNVLEHIKDDKKALENIYKLLSDGGYLILLVPAHNALYSTFDAQLGHYRRYTSTEVDKRLKAAGFKIEKCSYLNWWAAIGWFIFLKVAKRKDLPRPEVGIFNHLGKLFLWPEKYIAPPFGLSVLAIAKK